MRHKIIEGLKQAIAGDLARITIEGQTWVRLDPPKKLASRIEKRIYSIPANNPGKQRRRTMGSKTIGPWDIEVWEGGHPVWVTLRYGNAEIRFSHTELHDLHYAIGRAIKDARDQLPDIHKHEMD